MDKSFLSDFKAETKLSLSRQEDVT